MFYFPDVLQRGRGVFSTIWLVATKATRVTKREYLRVNVVTTCERILRYVCVEVVSLTPSHPRPRFSLYLSAQLEIGVVRVYHRQCDYLVDEIQSTLSRLTHYHIREQIDLETEQSRHLLPDMLCLMEESEWALNPFFGVLSTTPPLPSPSQIKSIQKSPVSRESDITSSPERITLQEKIPILLPDTEAGGVELLELTPGQMEKFLGEEYYFETETETTRKRQRLTDPSTIERQRRGTDTKIPHPEPSILVVEETGFDSTPPSDKIQLEPVSVGEDRERDREREGVEIFIPPLSVTDLQLPPPEGQRPRQRQRQRIPFADEFPQISRDVLKTLTETHDVFTLRPKPVLLPKYKGKSLSTLFTTPSTGWLPPVLLSLFDRCLKIRTVNYTEKRKLESEQIEILRAEQSLTQPQISTVSVEESVSESSRSTLHSPDRVLAEEEAMLPALVEVEESVSVSVSPTHISVHERTLSPARLTQLLRSVFREERIISFHSLVPVNASRALVSRLYYTCLVLAAQGLISLSQSVSYGDIEIRQRNLTPQP